MSIKERKEEAIKRMKFLGLSNTVIREFIMENKLNVSEHCGILYWLSEEEKEMVKTFEKQHNATVYHLIKSQVMGCIHLALLYVSNEKEEWQQDMQDLKEGYTVAKVLNLNIPQFSEIGTIGVKSQIGGLIRTC